jgi:hypothetical protein
MTCVHGEIKELVDSVEFLILRKGVDVKNKLRPIALHPGIDL